MHVDASVTACIIDMAQICGTLPAPPPKQQGLETELGAETADQVTVEVSTAGAERTLRVPQDLERFKART